MRNDKPCPIEFRDVRLSATIDRPGLRGIGLRLVPGAHVEVACTSEAVASAFLGLLTGAERPTSGSVLVDGVDVDFGTPITPRSQVRVVRPDLELGGATLWETIASGRPDANALDVIEVAEAVGLADIVRSLSRGLLTPVPRQRWALSWSIRLRIAVARELLWEPRCLILPVGESAPLDEARRTVSEVLRGCARGITTLIVSCLPTGILTKKSYFLWSEDCLAMPRRGETRRLGSTGRAGAAA